VQPLDNGINLLRAFSNHRIWCTDSCIVLEHVTEQHGWCTQAALCSRSTTASTSCKYNRTYSKLLIGDGSAMDARDVWCRDKSCARWCFTACAQHCAAAQPRRLLHASAQTSHVEYACLLTVYGA
jgi:hypothetical protein